MNQFINNMRLYDRNFANIIVMELIKKIQSYFKSLGMPIRISDFGINLTDDQFEELATKATFYGKRTLGSFMTLDHDRIKNIYTLAR